MPGSDQQTTMTENQEKRPGWVLSANAVPLVLGGMLMAHRSEEVLAMETNSESKVQPIRFGHSNIYLIQTESGYILVDAGMPGMEEKLDNVFREIGVEPQSVQLIIATHGHLDHVGSMTHAQKVTGGKVLCHRSVADDLANGKAERAVPRNLHGRLLNLLAGLTGSRFDGIPPDILVDDEFDLAEYGIAGKIIHTSGHSPSSICITLDNGEALKRLQSKRTGERS